MPRTPTIGPHRARGRPIGSHRVPESRASVSVWLPVRERDRLREVAAARGVSVSRVLRNVIVAGLADAAKRDQ